jgi:hypothetical protein
MSLRRRVSLSPAVSSPIYYYEVTSSSADTILPTTASKPVCRLMAFMVIILSANSFTPPRRSSATNFNPETTQVNLVLNGLQPVYGREGVGKRGNDELYFYSNYFYGGLFYTVHPSVSTM